MSIGPIQGVGQGAPSIAKPEMTEVPGAPDHDHDGDNAAGAASAAPAAAKPPVPGGLDVTG